MSGHVRRIKFFFYGTYDYVFSFPPCDVTHIVNDVIRCLKEPKITSLYVMHFIEYLTHVLYSLFFSTHNIEMDKTSGTFRTLYCLYPDPNCIHASQLFYLCQAFTEILPQIICRMKRSTKLSIYNFQIET